MFLRPLVESGVLTNRPLLPAAQVSLLPTRRFSTVSGCRCARRLLRGLYILFLQGLLKCSKTLASTKFMHVNFVVQALHVFRYFLHGRGVGRFGIQRSLGKDETVVLGDLALVLD